MGGKHSNSRRGSIKINVKFKNILTKLCDDEIHYPNTILSAPKLEDLWKEQLSTELLSILMMHFSRQALTVDLFISFYHQIVEGPPDEKAAHLFVLFENPQVMKTYDMIHYVYAMVKSVVKLLEKNELYQNWLQLSTVDAFSMTDTFTKYLLHDFTSHSQIEVQRLASWLYKSTHFLDLSNYVYNVIFEISTPNDLKLPEPIVNTNNSEKTIMTAGEVLFFSLLLQKNFIEKWRLLYSSKTYGNSWATLSKCISAQGPTLILVKGTNGLLIGGFASESWNFRPDFYGDDYSFIFQLRPSIEIFEATNYNKNFQYFNTGQGTLPNGLGMGGQFGYWGFFITSEFGKCMVSETCTTFRNYKINTVIKEFDIQDLEIWGVGKADPTPAELGERENTHDKDLTARSLLEIAGRKSYAVDLDLLPPDNNEKE
ncbi:TLD domain-containing protein 1-like [Cimex lectularius]|uniref:MTOR-associated protein MEAK7 n=1 Tax=Cimex lectularius TaxID=79782 RepID=A0A8I6TB26_CIMLE|nr:TLD domain-containing protein 1-like [Cimex lectularius]